MALHKVGSVSGISDGEMQVVDAGGEEVLLLKTEGQVYAVAAICTHALGYLDQGDLEEFTVFCPLHEGSFDVRTGAALTLPCTEPLKTFPVKVEGDDIFVEA